MPLDTYFYIPSRYPDALPGTLEEGMPSKRDAEISIQAAQHLISLKVGRVVPNAPPRSSSIPQAGSISSTISNRSHHRNECLIPLPDQSVLRNSEPLRGNRLSPLIKNRQWPIQCPTNIPFMDQRSSAVISGKNHSFLPNNSTRRVAPPTLRHQSFAPLCLRIIH